MAKKEKIAAVIVAAGESSRMGDIDKLFVPLGGEPLLLRTTRAFQQCEKIDQIVVVVSGGNRDKCRHLTTGDDWHKVSDICLGGPRRQDSVAYGLGRLKKCDWVVIHDGARPFVTRELIEDGLEAARETGAAIAAVPVTDTIKMSGDDNIVMGTPPRENFWAVQTPQVFRYEIITEAHKKAEGDVTDDASLVERLGHKVKIYPGSYDNLKITTPADLALAMVLVEKNG